MDRNNHNIEDTRAPDSQGSRSMNDDQGSVGGNDIFGGSDDVNRLSLAVAAAAAAGIPSHHLSDGSLDMIPQQRQQQPASAAPVAAAPVQLYAALRQLQPPLQQQQQHQQQDAMIIPPMIPGVINHNMNNNNNISNSNSRSRAAAFPAIDANLASRQLAAMRLNFESIDPERAAGETDVESGSHYSSESSGWSIVETTRGTPPSERSLHAAAVLNGVMYVFGGYSGEARVNTFHAYSFAEKRWSPVLPSATSGPPPSPRDRHVAVVFGNSFMVHGGFDGTSRVSDFHAFDFSSMTWREIIALQGRPPSPRHSHAAVVHGNSMYVFGGMYLAGCCDCAYGSL